ncbi:MAG: hypothetical protein ACSLFM_01020 [Tepidiformaceae bacterium]
MSKASIGRKDAALLDECAAWIWEVLQEEEGMFLGGELIELILTTERELGLAHRQPEEVATLLDEEFRMRGISTNPTPIDLRIIRTVLDWETEFLGFAGILRGDLGEP